MKKILISFIAILILAAARADEAADDIMARYNASLGKAKAYCVGLNEQINAVKPMAGISTSASTLTTIAGGTAAVAGVMKSANDKKIDGLASPEAKMARAKELEAKVDAGTIEKEEAAELVQLAGYLKNKEQMTGELRAIDAAKGTSNSLGNLRTLGGFTSGAGGITSAATSLSGVALIDKLIEDMNACDSYVQEIEKQMTELRFAEPDNPALAKMSGIVDNCKGMSSKNISDIKGAMKAAGVISAIGAAAGVTSGITSAVAGAKEKNGASATGAEGKESTKSLNLTANISAGVAAGAGLSGAILSGTALVGLMKNGDIAKNCGSAF